MKEKGVGNLGIYSANGFKSRTSEVDSLSKMNLMIKGIKKRGFEGFGVKVISGEIESLEVFHSL